MWRTLFFSRVSRCGRASRCATAVVGLQRCLTSQTRCSSSAQSPKSITHESSPRTVVVKADAQFSGTHLNAAWTRQFILGSLLQRYDPLRHAPERLKTSSSALSSATARSVEAVLLESQRRLSSTWKLPVRPLDAVSEARILRLLARYAAGEGTLSDTALEMLQHVLTPLPGAPASIADPVQMRTLLELIGYVVPGDNLFRVSYAGELHYPPQAHAFVTDQLQEGRQREGGDSFDAIRERRPGPGYAIDSATTSEVDDAIGVCVDPRTGERYFVVYVSDATVYCPFDSLLEQVTARRLTTTTYLPEGVYFMLPKPIVEASTLREDRPCRTFNVVFQVDEATGEVKNYSVAVGWLDRLRRITYDQLQELIDHEKDNTGDAVASSASQTSSSRLGEGDDDSATGTTSAIAGNVPSAKHPPPMWVTPHDRDNFSYILRIARIRLRARLERQRSEGPSGETAAPTARPVDFSLPDPLIKVRGTTVLSVSDQVISTQDARLAVAELMIAANEVCSRVAQANHLSIPFRGTRARSSEHLVAEYYTEPQGVGMLTSLDDSHLFLAEAMQSSVRRLSTVTRAIYHHIPIHHVGLDTTFYTHSTSPLRRYADMLVHHQLKTWLWQQHHGGGGSRSQSSSDGITSPRLVGPQPFIPEYAMASLCAMISTKQERARLLQDSSTRFWILRYLEDLERQQESCPSTVPAHARPKETCCKRRYFCLVGETRRVVAAPAYSRFACSPSELSQLLSHPLPSPVSSRSTPRRPASVQFDTNPRWRQDSPQFLYVSDVYIPEVQLAHTLTHHRDDVRVGAVLECEVMQVQPTQGLLELRICRVVPGGDERDYERLWMGGLVSQLDA